MSDIRSRGEAPSFDLVLFIWARRKIIITITLLGMIGGVVASLLITPLFKSESVLFPAITNSLAKAVLNELPSNRDDILGLGDDDDAEKLLQMLGSNTIRDRIIEKYDLYTVYDIPREKPAARHRVNETYKDRFRFERTRFGSVRVSVMDQEPERAAAMANDVVALVDTVWRNMAHERADKSLDMVRAKVARLNDELRQMEDSLRMLRLMGVHDYRSQTERFNEYLGQAIVRNDQRAINELERRFKQLAEIGGAYTSLEQRHTYELARHTALKKNLEKAEADLESRLPFSFVVDHAEPADKRSHPIRWLVVLLSTVAAFVLALLLLVVQENIRKIQNIHGH